MPNRLSKILSRSSKEKEAEAEAERNKSSSSNPSPPPEYAQAPPNYDAENRLDPPDITAGFARLNLSGPPKDTPQVDQCIAHLTVLECFYRLKQNIASTDGLFGIENNSIIDAPLDNDKRGVVFAKLAEKRWAIYVSRAVDRFAQWVETIAPVTHLMSIEYFETYGKAGTLCDPSPKYAPIRLDRNNMPPTDVLMVWHAYMLNPRAYLEDCLRLRRMSLWHTAFPWEEAIHSINLETFANEVDDEVARNFTTSTGLPWNQLDDLETPRTVECPNCNMQSTCQYTTVPTLLGAHQTGTYDSWESLGKFVDNSLSSGTGFCDSQFNAGCPHCALYFSHEVLAAGKFCADVQRLLKDDVPMRGTLLGYEGLPWSYGNETDTMFATTRVTPFINLFLKAGLGTKLCDLYSSRDATNISDMRLQIELLLADRKYLRAVKGITTGRLVKADRVSIRKCLSQYWNNGSPFALDLVGAVIRQGAFVEKMHNIDWIHSPALPSTMKRLLVKYQRFISIMKDKTHMAVPTLDVDLAWHTHQLTPYQYMVYTVKHTGQFIDHDDKVAETALNDAFAWTSKTYQKLYHEPYSECTCWYCEAIRESTTSVTSRLFNSKNSQASEQLHDAEQDPRKSVHISTHNMVRPEDGNYQTTANLKAEQLEKAYEKACERARKKGRKEPKRDDYYWSDAYGHPVYIPAYSPYIGAYYGYMPMYYPVSPACMAVGAGAAGNCAAGTCGGGVAAGSCAGSGGGCAAGPAGGCAGASLAGGCGGAGGGGCGGGGGGCGGGGGGGGCGGGGGG